jgi:hypothetical protein
MSEAWCCLLRVGFLSSVEKIRIIPVCKSFHTLITTNPDSWAHDVFFATSSPSQLSNLPLHGTDLHVSCKTITDANMDQLAILARLKVQSLHLDLSQCKVIDYGMFWLRELPLITLNLRECDIDDIGMSHLSTLNQLANLDISDCAISDAGLLHLRNLPLQILKINRDSNIKKFRTQDAAVITDIGCSYFTSMPLHTLLMTGCELTDVGISLLPTTIHTLDLSGALINAQALMTLSKFPLQSLKLFGCDLKLSMLAYFAFGHLRSLGVGLDQCDDEGCEYLGTFPELQELYITGFLGLSNQSIGYICQNLSLRELYVDGMNFHLLSDSGFSVFNRLSRLEALCVRSLSHVSYSLTDDCLHFLAHLASLRSIELENFECISAAGWQSSGLLAANPQYAHASSLLAHKYLSVNDCAEGSLLLSGARGVTATPVGDGRPNINQANSALVRQPRSSSALIPRYYENSYLNDPRKNEVVEGSRACENLHACEGCECHTCTFVNPSSLALCSMCNTRRLDAKQNQGCLANNPNPFVPPATLPYSVLSTECTLREPKRRDPFFSDMIDNVSLTEDCIARHPFNRYDVDDSSESKAMIEDMREKYDFHGLNGSILTRDSKFEAMSKSEVISEHVLQQFHCLSDLELHSEFATEGRIAIRDDQNLKNAIFRSEGSPKVLRPPEISSFRANQIHRLWNLI